MTVESDTGAVGADDGPHEVEVLVVDADAEYLVDLLDRIDSDAEELSVQTSRDVEETIERLEEGTVDCLVCTYDAGKMQSLELLDYMRDKVSEVPLVLLPARETTIIDSENLVADVDAVFSRDEAVERDVLGPHLVNVVEQKRAAVAAERRSQVTDVMGKVARDVAGAEEPETVTGATVDRLDDAPAFDAGLVADVDGQTVRPEAATAEDITTLPGVEADGPAAPLASAARRSVEAEQPEVVTTDDYTYAVVPVTPDRGDPRALAVSSDSKFAFREPEVDLLSELGGTMSRTLETIATREALESRVDDLELVDELVEDLGVGVVVYDADGLVERANEKFADVAGRDREDLPGTFVWNVLDAREPTTFDEHWAATDPDEPTTETTTVGGDERELVTTRVEAEGEPYNVTMVVDPDDDAPMDREFAEMLSYEFHHWFDVAQEAMEEARDTGDVERLELVDEIVDRMQDAIETEVTTVTEPDTEWATEPLLLGEVAGVAWNHVLGEAGSHEVKGGRAVLAHRGLLLRLFEHLFRTLLQYAEGATAIDVGITAGGFYVEDDGAGVPHDERAYESDGQSATSATHGAGILVARRAATRMDWDLSVTGTDDGGTRFEVTGVTFVTEDA